jgi:hypothetical protein
LLVRRLGVGGPERGDQVGRFTSKAGMSNTSSPVALRPVFPRPAPAAGRHGRDGPEADLPDPSPLAERVPFGIARATNQPMSRSDGVMVVKTDIRLSH